MATLKATTFNTVDGDSKLSFNRAFQNVNFWDIGLSGGGTPSLKISTTSDSFTPIEIISDTRVDIINISISDLKVTTSGNLDANVIVNGDFECFAPFSTSGQFRFPNTTTATTQPVSDNSTKIATTSFVQQVRAQSSNFAVFLDYPVPLVSLYRGYRNATDNYTDLAALYDSTYTLTKFADDTSLISYQTANYSSWVEFDLQNYPDIPNDASSIIIEAEWVQRTYQFPVPTFWLSPNASDARRFKVAYGQAHSNQDGDCPGITSQGIFPVEASKFYLKCEVGFDVAIMIRIVGYING